MTTPFERLKEMQTPPEYTQHFTDEHLRLQNVHENGGKCARCHGEPEHLCSSLCPYYVADHTADGHVCTAECSEFKPPDEGTNDA